MGYVLEMMSHSHVLTLLLSPSGQSALEELKLAVTTYGIILTPRPVDQEVYSDHM